MDIFNHAAALNNASNDESFLAEIVQMFLEDTLPEMDGLQQAVSAKDADKIRFHAHTLKGMAGNLGGDVLHAVCLEAENAGRNADFEAAAALCPKVQQALDEFSSCLKTECLHSPGK